MAVLYFWKYWTALITYLFSKKFLSLVSSNSESSLWVANYVFRRDLCPIGRIFLKICLRWLNIRIGVSFFFEGTTFPLLCRFRLFCTNVRWTSSIYDTIDFSFFSFPWIYLWIGKVLRENRQLQHNENIFYTI